MGITDLSEALNYLLLDVKGLNYQFGDKPAPQPQKTPIGYSFYDPTTFETVTPVLDGDRNHLEDPVISRLASLIEEF